MVFYCFLDKNYFKNLFMDKLKKFANNYATVEEMLIL